MAMLTSFPSLLTCSTRLAGRSNGSLSGNPSCPMVPVVTSPVQPRDWASNFVLLEPYLPCLHAASCSLPSVTVNI